MSVSIPTYALYTDAFVDEVPFPYMTIPANASVLFPITVIYDLHGERFLLEEAGQYQLQIRCFIATEDATGAIVEQVAEAKETLTVTKHQGKDKDLWKRIVVAGGLRLPLSATTLKDLNTLVYQFPLSPYRPYALAILGGVFEPVGEEQIARTQRISYLQELLNKHPQFRLERSRCGQSLPVADERRRDRASPRSRGDSFQRSLGTAITQIPNPPISAVRYLSEGQNGWISPSHTIFPNKLP